MPSPESEQSAAAASHPAPWVFAGLLLTYWCNARCAFCYVNCSPHHRVWMAPRDALALWRGLDRHAAEHGLKMRIHLAGGEPFGDWPRLLSIIREARDAGLTPLEKVETNAGWAVSDGLVRSRLEQLDALGMERLFVSSDTYHQQFVPFENVRRCVEIARRVLGPTRVRVRWWDFYNNPVDTRALAPDERRAAFRIALAHHPDRLTGRAAVELSGLLPLHPAEHFRGRSCIEEALLIRHVHIDPYGHVFPGVCNGIILGNALREPPEQLWARLAETWTEHPIVAAVVAGGSYELMRRADEFGYQPRAEGYADKCHLCHDVRRFLFERGMYPEAVGPAECY
jgi:hypothetical protein